MIKSIQFHTILLQICVYYEVAVEEEKKSFDFFLVRRSLS